MLNMGNPFIPEKNRIVPKGQVFIPIDKNMIREYEVKEVVKKTGDGDEDYVVVKKVVLAREYNRNDYVNSFNDEVGVKNIMKKVQLTGDITLLNQRGLSALNNGEEVLDLTQMTTDPIKANKIVSDAVALFDSLPAEMKKDMSYEEFITKFDIDAYVKSQTAAKEEVKEDVK